MDVFNNISLAICLSEKLERTISTRKLTHETTSFSFSLHAIFACNLRLFPYRNSPFPSGSSCYVPILTEASRAARRHRSSEDSRVSATALWRYDLQVTFTSLTPRHCQYAARISHFAELSPFRLFTRRYELFPDSERLCTTGAMRASQPGSFRIVCGGRTIDVRLLRTFLILFYCNRTTAPPLTRRIKTR